jgi:uncharacterized membrane protein YgdD (TMEM256/DUF423 family)
MSGVGETAKGARCSAPFLILTWAGLAGAAGVALAAVAAHKADSPALAIAATMLTLHAAAAVGIIAVALRAARPCLWSAVAGLMLAGASLFGGEIAFHTLTENAAFQMLAPVGGTLMIASWLGLAVLAIVNAFGNAE